MEKCPYCVGVHIVEVSVMERCSYCVVVHFVEVNGVVSMLCTGICVHVVEMSCL